MREELTPEFVQEADKKTVRADVPVRAAASLLIIDTSDNELKLLTGVRKKTLAFMPGLTVFPGGAVDEADASTPPSFFQALTLDALRMRSVESDTSLNAFGMAALRETKEETGIEIDGLSCLRLVARAITPPYRPRRFDTLFFAIDRKHVQAEPYLQTTTDLEAIEWLNLTQLEQRPLAFITRQILADIRGELISGKQTQGAYPFYYAEANKYYREWLSPPFK